MNKLIILIALIPLAIIIAVGFGSTLGLR